MKEEQNENQRLFEVYLLDDRKPRLPKRFSWPVGIEFLSKRLGHIPQADCIKVWFYDHPLANYAKTMEQIANRGLVYPILTVWYYNKPFGAEWILMMYPVESVRRPAVRSMLDSAFATIDRWLCEIRTPVWLSSSHHLDCIFDPLEQTLSVVERPQS